MEENRVKEIVDKFDLKFAIRDGKEGIMINKKYLKNKKMVEEIKANRDKFIVYLKKQEEERKAREEARKEKEKKEREEERRKIHQDEEKIQLHYEDGEYLQGYMAFGEGSDILEEEGAAHYVSGWGRLVDSDLVEKLGTEFTYSELMAYVTPIRKAKEQKMAEKEAREKARVAAIFAKAKETGERQELGSYSVPCNDPNEECNLDIITVWAMPDGSEKTTRNHTW